MRRRPACAAALEGVEWRERDLLDGELADLVDGCDAVVHLAALVHHPEVTAQDAYDRANVETTRRLLAAAATRGIAGDRIVFASSVAVYGRDAAFHADEDTPCAPVTPYARSKLRAERLVNDCGGVILRFPVVYGAGDRGNVATLISAIERRRFVLPTPADQPRSFLSSANAAEAIRLAVERGRGAGLFLITDNDDATLARMVDAIVRSLPDAPAVRRVPAAVLAPAAAFGSLLRRLGLPAPITRDQLRKLTTRLTFAIERARSELGYEPVISFEDGVAQAVQDRTVA